MVGQTKHFVTAYTLLMHSDVQVIMKHVPRGHANATQAT